MEKDYVQYGPEWEKEMMKMSKVHIIDMLRKALTSNDEAWKQALSDGNKRSLTIKKE